ncbi:MAG: ribokinase [Pseudomonadota bacterium]
MRAPRVVVVGSVNMDLVFRTPRMPLVGETLVGSGFARHPGGKGANQAVAATRMQARTSLIGCTGDDEHGAVLRAGLAADHIDLAHLARDAQLATGIAAIMVDDEGRNSIVLASGANLALAEAHIDAAAALIAGADVLVCQLEVPMAAVRRAISLAHRAGVAVVFNPSPMAPLDGELLRMVDYLVVNETEAEQLSGVVVDGIDGAKQAAAAILALGPGCVLLTMGARGVLVAGACPARLIEGLKVEVRDTTAAGDTFAGALAVGIGQGLGGLEAAERAQYAAALAVTQAGAQSSIPTLEQVERFMR